MEVSILGWTWVPGFGVDGGTGPLPSCLRSKGRTLMWSLVKVPFWLIVEEEVLPMVVGGLSMDTDIGGTWWPCVCNDDSNNKRFFFVRFCSSPLRILLASYEAGMLIRKSAIVAKRSICREIDGIIFGSKVSLPKRVKKCLMNKIWGRIWFIYREIVYPFVMCFEICIMPNLG